MEHQEMSQSFVQERRRASSPAQTYRRILSNWCRSVEIWLNRRYGRQELSSLDDRLLDDIGISREDALWKASKPFWRP
jgi:uncharacterized protein YjiS (DUF1127 family)